MPRKPWFSKKLQHANLCPDPKPKSVQGVPGSDPDAFLLVLPVGSQAGSPEVLLDLGFRGQGLG